MICEYCGKEFEPKSLRGRPQIYCNPKCNGRAWKKNNPERNRELKRKSSKKHPEQRRKWRKKNLEKCKTRVRKQNKKLYYLNKQRALDYKGGCVICGSKKNIHYHHLNPDEKKNNVSNLFHRWKWKKIKPELDKCVPLCNKFHTSMETQLRHFKEKLMKGGYKPK